MTFESLWEGMLRKNPKLASETAKVTITAEQFKRALFQAYSAGEANSKGEQMFNQLFGGLR